MLLRLPNESSQSEKAPHRTVPVPWHSRGGQPGERAETLMLERGQAEREEPRNVGLGAGKHCGWHRDGGCLAWHSPIPQSCTAQLNSSWASVLVPLWCRPQGEAPMGTPCHLENWHPSLSWKNKLFGNLRRRRNKESDHTRKTRDLALPWSLGPGICGTRPPWGHAGVSVLSASRDDGPKVRGNAESVSGMATRKPQASCATVGPIPPSASCCGSWIFLSMLCWKIWNSDLGDTFKLLLQFLAGVVENAEPAIWCFVLFLFF